MNRAMSLLARKTDEEEPETPYAGLLWDYKAVSLDRKAGIAFEDSFKKLGRQGWEFVATAQSGSAHRAIFKRPLV